MCHVNKMEIQLRKTSSCISCLEVYISGLTKVLFILSNAFLHRRTAWILMCRKISACTFRPTFTGLPSRIANLNLLFHMGKSKKTYILLEENEIYCILLFSSELLIHVIRKTYDSNILSTVQYRQNTLKSI